MIKPASFASIAFTGNRIDRQSEKREDDSVERAREVCDANVLGFVNGLVVLKNDDPFLKLSQIADFAPHWPEAVFLGYEDGQPVLAVDLGVEVEAISASFRVISLRALYSEPQIAPHRLGALAQATSLLNWHRNNGYCTRCGSKTKMRGGGVRRQCDNCSAEHFPRIDPVAIMLVHKADKCLLARNSSFPENRFSCLAGFIEQGETFEAAVRREVAEEVSIKVGEVTYLASQPWPFPQALMLGCMAQALDEDITIDDVELAEAGWFTRDDVKKMLGGCHPGGITLPPEGAIASFLIRSWVGE